jgi:hypothetical protein
MPTALSAGIYSRPFDWLFAERGQPDEEGGLTGAERGVFEDWPDLQSVEAVRFRDPNNKFSTLVILDARDVENRPHRLTPQSNWGPASRRVLPILRRWLKYLDERPPAAPTEGARRPVTAASPSVGAGEDPGDSILTGHLSNHTDATEDDALGAVNAALPGGAKMWTLDRLRKNKTWKGYRNGLLTGYFANNPDATVEEAAAHMGVEKSTLHGMQAYKDHKARREQENPRPPERKSSGDDRKKGGPS